MPAVSKHLKVLERAGLITRGREAQWRPCRLNASPLKQAANWIEEYRQFWMPYIDALERHLDRMKAAGAEKKKSSTKRAADGAKSRVTKTRKAKSR